jgi:hypothetical protein
MLMNGKELVPVPFFHPTTVLTWQKGLAPMPRLKGCDKPITEFMAPTKFGPMGTIMKREYVLVRAPKLLAVVVGVGRDVDQIPFHPVIFLTAAAS